MPRIHAPKVVADPIYGIIDIRPVLPMIETREFQALADKRQLGMSYLTFPSATHTRRAHSLGAYHATKMLADRWLKLDLINKEEAAALAGYALYHDIGHPAFSHVTEELCAPKLKVPGLETNDLLSLEIIMRLKKPIEQCGIRYALFEKIARHENPLYLAVHDRNLGMEKLDYLERDGLYTILSQPAGVEYLRRHIYFINNELAIDSKVIDNAIEMQNFYLKMYKNVYLRKTSAIAQRMLQKMVHHLIAAKEISADDLPTLTDSELLGIMRFSKNKTVALLYELLRRRELFRETIVIRSAHFAQSSGQAGKSIATFGATDTEINDLLQSKKFDPKNQSALEETEKSIASLAGLSPNDVLVVPVFSSWRFHAKDIMIYGEKGKLSSLKERYPAHFKNMEEVAKSYMALRICTFEKYRKKLSDPKVAKKVFELVTRAA
ncbi:MAG: HD domain-containing protein [Parcubacteria group bacterium]|nr:HD domain-containing protein [Parcubacteria group bacterium]